MKNYIKLKKAESIFAILMILVGCIVSMYIIKIIKTTKILINFLLGVEN